MEVRCGKGLRGMLRVMAQVRRSRAARGRSSKTSFTAIAAMKILEVSPSSRGSPRRSVSWNPETPLLVGVVLPAPFPPFVELYARRQ